MKIIGKLSSERRFEWLDSIRRNQLCDRRRAGFLMEEGATIYSLPPPPMEKDAVCWILIITLSHIHISLHKSNIHNLIHKSNIHNLLHKSKIHNLKMWILYLFRKKCEFHIFKLWILDLCREIFELFEHQICNMGKYPPFAYLIKLWILIITLSHIPISQIINV